MDEKIRGKDNTSCKRKYVQRNKDVNHFLENENTSRKRKYVWRYKDVIYSSDTATNALGDIVDTERKGKAKSPRRCLNFNSEEPQYLEEFSFAMSLFNKAVRVHGLDECDEGVVRSMRLKEAVHSTRALDHVAVKPSIWSASVPNTLTYHSHTECLQQISVPIFDINKIFCALDKQIPPLKSLVNHFKAIAWKAICFNLDPFKSSSEFSSKILNPSRNSNVPPKGTKRCHLYIDEAEVSTFSLMGKDCDKGDEQLDVDKEKWWDEERRVFQGRVDSFFAQIHLVQGDRHFSQWKDSLVDSVVGVFLIQNVSDHLSSSAFMSLAANFPLQSRSK